MKHILTAFFLAMLWVSPAMAGTFEEANAGYQSGDFKAAIAGYESLIKDGEKTAAIYYNLGNAYFRLGQKGKAQVNYRRALRLAPRDADVRWNQHILKSTLADKLDSTDGPITEWLKWPVKYLSLSELMLMLSAALVALAVFAAFSVIFPDRRAWARPFRAVAVLTVLVSAVLLAAQWPDIARPLVVITQKEIAVRYGPSFKETRALLLHEGAEARVDDTTKDWLYITLENGTGGWIPESAAEAVT